MHYTNLLKFVLVSLTVSEEDHSNANCFVMVISSHGDDRTQVEKGTALTKRIREDVVSCTDYYLPTRELVNYFTDGNCPSLIGKPRLFFIQVSC